MCFSGLLLFRVTEILDGHIGPDSCAVRDRADERIGLQRRGYGPARLAPLRLGEVNWVSRDRFHCSLVN